MQDIIGRLNAKKAELDEKRGDEGFTLIELLVVVVIIGVLVAIAVPVYLNYRQGAADKSAQSDVRGAISAVEQFYTSNGNTYPATTSAAAGATSLTLTAISGSAGTITLSDKSQLGYVYNSTAGTYKICANNTGGSGKWYIYDSAVGGSVKASTATLTISAC
ncbi:prepilin-type N-terminal cleavage/methylation domain-containing protein [Actinoplanes sp. NPDC051851]|uniref:prepilin-type N-terminal cleavage/methylation domain-containing protein n=1 Tax=Actinoplanes sp. NPDC051851 TaxID=3154753 RepID=UPI003442FCCB